MCSIVLAAVILTAVVLVASRHGRDGFETGPYNIGLYDNPYTHYPHYKGRESLPWDSDRRCTANCSQSPCTIWCR